MLLSRLPFSSDIAWQSDSMKCSLCISSNSQPWRNLQVTPFCTSERSLRKFTG